jgi:hypothetical protein
VDPLGIWVATFVTIVAITGYPTLHQAKITAFEAILKADFP